MGLKSNVAEDYAAYIFARIMLFQDEDKMLKLFTFLFSKDKWCDFTINFKNLYAWFFNKLFRNILILVYKRSNKLIFKT